MIGTAVQYKLMFFDLVLERVSNVAVSRRASNVLEWSLQSHSALRLIVLL